VINWQLVFSNIILVSVTFFANSICLIATILQLVEINRLLANYLTIDTKDNFLYLSQILPEENGIIKLLFVDKDYGFTVRFVDSLGNLWRKIR
jgi:hypothetical protein